MGKRKQTGFVLYRGPSQLDGQPIVAIATIGSKNGKTGAMVQTWIMREDVAPHDALKTGDDSSVCGECPHRPMKGGACYVTVFQAPLAVWRAYHRGRYGEPLTWPERQALGRGRVVRLGSYGDPAAVPLDVWEALTDEASAFTGYTHQWRTAPQQSLRHYCMASCDTPADFEAARAMGWRTFREVVCPASDEGGNKLKCADCKSCSGCATDRKGTIVIVAHGPIGKVRAYEKMRLAA
jgi:hypothetical protein